MPESATAVPESGRACVGPPNDSTRRVVDQMTRAASSDRPMSVVSRLASHAATISVSRRAETRAI